MPHKRSASMIPNGSSSKNLYTNGPPTPRHACVADADEGEIRKHVQKGIMQGQYGQTAQRMVEMTRASVINEEDEWAGVSPVYGPPEVLRDEVTESANPQYPRQWDVYSWAVMMYEVYAGRGYFEHMSVWKLRTAVIDGERPADVRTLESCPEEIRQLIVECWTDDPAERPLFPEVAHRTDACLKALLDQERVVAPPMLETELPVVPGMDEGHRVARVYSPGRTLGEIPRHRSRRLVTRETSENSHGLRSVSSEGSVLAAGRSSPRTRQGSIRSTDSTSSRTTDTSVSSYGRPESYNAKKDKKNRRPSTVPRQPKARWTGGLVGAQRKRLSQQWNSDPERGNGGKGVHVERRGAVGGARVGEAGGRGGGGGGRGGDGGRRDDGKRGGNRERRRPYSESPQTSRRASPTRRKSPLSDNPRENSNDDSDERFAYSGALEIGSMPMQSTKGVSFMPT
jgi:hypothetical protein